MEGPSRAEHSWQEAFAIYSNPRVVAMVFLGFAAGLPYLLVFSTLTARLADDGVSRTAIGFFAWIGITYSIKVLWAPVVDRLELPVLTTVLGRRRSWMLVGQLGVAAGLAGLAFSPPSAGLAAVAYLALLVAFASATQDIAIDAFRIESMAEEYQGAMSAAYIFGYRVGLLAAGAGALYLADLVDWRTSYLAMASLMMVGAMTVLLVPEPATGTESHGDGRPGKKLERFVAWLNQAVVQPFADFFRRNGRFALVILLFIALFRLSDIAMGIMANPFYLDLGYTKTEIANVAKVFGFFMTILGSAACGVAVVRYGLYRPLLAGAVLVSVTNLLFAMLTFLDHELVYLAIVISADNISGGIASTAFVAYLSSLTNRAYTATQYALFSSLMTLPGKLISGFSGVVVDGYGYAVFFVTAAALGLPAIVLVLVIMRRSLVRSDPSGSARG